ncbi:ABC transporter permease [Halalkalibacter sp. AB-rgal2]|uniref:ABC transporter permease n=1 Tax=Halalkalibacter sp. AB-rgal2 TaxID=3242695 RepID=UPI00359E2F21
MKDLKGATKAGLPAIVTVAMFVLIWELIVRVTDIEPYILPAPSEIFLAFGESWTLLPEHIWITAIEALLGFSLGIIVALVIALSLDASAILRKSVYPLLLFSQTIPIIAIAPLLIIWFGYGILPKVLVVALVTFFPVVVNMIEGLQSSDRDMMRLLQSMGSSRWQTMRYVRFPHALPYLFTGLKIGATYSVLAAVISEWVGASKGLGIYLVRAQNSFATDKVFVSIVIISLLSCFLFLIIVLISRWTMPWKYKHMKKGSGQS